MHKELVQAPDLIPLHLGANALGLVVSYSCGSTRSQIPASSGLNDAADLQKVHLSMTVQF